MVSPLGLGTVKLGRDKLVKYPENFEIPDDKSATNLINLAKDLGINLIDTAPAYGNSEQRLGRLLRRQRHDWVICSKAGEEFDNSTAQSSFNFTPEHIRFSVERSLQRLQTDFIDILLIHSNGEDVDIINKYGVFQVLDSLKQEGKIRASGMSSKTVAGGIMALQQSDCAMVTYNLNQSDEQAVIDYAAINNKAILLKKVLASGQLQQGEQTPSLQQSFNFIFAKSAVTAAITGTINPEHLRANVAATKNALADF